MCDNKKVYMARKKKKKTILRRCADGYHTIPERVREIIFGGIATLIAVFFTLVLINAAGSFGMTIRDTLFLRSNDDPALLGWSFLLLIVFFAFLGLSLIANIRPISHLRLWIGSILGFFSIATFFAASFDETAGGSIGNIVFSALHNVLGVFSYILIPIGILGSLYILTMFSPTTIWDWLTSHRNDDEDEDEDDEEYDDDEDEEEYDDDDEEDGDEDEYDDDEEEEDEYEDEEEEEDDRQTHGTEIAAYIPPPLALLSSERGKGRAENTKAQAQTIARTLKNFKISVTVEEVTVGPTFTRYAVRPAEGIRLSKITGLQQNLELALAAHPIRIEAPIPGESLVGIEVPNSARATVGLRTLLESSEFEKTKGALPLAIGKTINGSVFAKSLSKMPHALVAGTTGSGKSVLIHNFILSLLFSYGPRDLRFIFIDPKRVELTLYKGIPHLYTDPITEPKKALQALVWVVNEMERRYELLEERGARGIISYNDAIENEEERMPYLVVVVDELADLMQSFPREIEGNIVRITQKSRAVGIHLIISTQRPSVNIITGVVKANVPVRVALQVASGIDSRTILDATGAENLIGSGDLLFGSAESKKPVRVQSAFIDEREVKKIAQHIIRENGVAENLIDVTQKQKGGNSGSFDMDDDDDNLYTDARDIVITAKKASTSLLQRKLKIGYSRAARLIDMLEEHGVVGPQIGSKPREILVENSDDGFDDEMEHAERNE